MLVAAAIRLQLCKGQQGMEVPCVDVRLLALTLCILCASCFALLAVSDMVRDAASPTKHTDLPSPPLAVHF